jgi:hypothetical protein
MDDPYAHRDLHHYLISQHQDEARRDATTERLARAAPRTRNWRLALSRLLIHLGTLLVSAGEALRRKAAGAADPGPPTAVEW